MFRMKRLRFCLLPIARSFEMKKYLIPLSILAVLFAFILSSNAAELKLPNFLENAKVGQWLLYEMQQGMRMKQTVTDVTDDEVVVTQEMIMNGQTMAKQVVRLDKNPDQEGAVDVGGHHIVPKVSKGKIKVKGKSMDCYIIEYTSQGQKTISYMSGDIPINGIIKTEVNGNTMLMLLDYSH